MQLEIELLIESLNTAIPSKDNFTEWCKIALPNDKENASVCIRIVDSDEMKLLNQQYRNKPGPTNVLSFPARIPAALNLNILGDIIICAPVVEKEALNQKKESLHHWAHLTLHGFLHLLGYDHQTNEEAEIMEGLEIFYLKSLGFPNPYLLITPMENNKQ